jgi:ferredoxin-fold anticodon binding domain-containing protein
MARLAEELKKRIGRQIMVILATKENIRSGTLQNVSDDYLELHVDGYSDTDTLFIRIDAITVFYEVTNT